MKVRKSRLLKKVAKLKALVFSLQQNKKWYRSISSNEQSEYFDI